MALDLANGYSRKDSASASNVYYAYEINSGASEGDKVFSIRRVNTTSGVETVTWANGSQTAFISNWTDRVSSFTTPSGSLNISSTYSTVSINSIPTYRAATFTWSAIPGVNQFFLTSKDESGRTLNQDGAPLQGFYVERTYTTNLFNLTTYNQSYLNPGTYTFTVNGTNIAGSTTSTVTINFPT